jgi:hypothetical protein
MNGTTMTSSTSLGNVSGYADILWQNTSGELYLWLMNGTTIAGGGIVGNVSSGWNVAGIGDFNADGDADILWRNSTTGQVYVWLMNGTTIASMGSPGTPTSDWSIAGVGDFDGNGTSDILWRNSTTGQVFLWLMNGTTFPSSGSVSYVSSDWVIQGVGDYDGSGRGRHPVAEQLNGAGLRLADERDHADEHRQPWHPRDCLANSYLISIGLLDVQEDQKPLSSRSDTMGTRIRQLLSAQPICARWPLTGA